MSEIWKDCPHYPNYLISNRGRVFDLTTHRIVKIWQNNEGYQLVQLRNNTNRNEKIHRLVALAFIPNPENKPMVNHKDENPLNNFVENLEWCSAQYNANYGTRNERMAQNHKYPKLGDNPRARAVFCVELNKTFDCAKRAEKELGIWGSSIGSACRGKWKTAGGFHWKYVDD